MLYNRPPRPEPTEMGVAKCVCCSRRIRRECGYERACGGDRRRRSDGDDAGGRAGVGEGRRRGRRAASRSRARRLTGRRLSLAHDRGARSARGRRSVPRGGSGGSGLDDRHDRAGHERLPDASSLFARDLAEPDRADHGRLDRRAAGADLLRMRGDGLRAGRHRRRRRAGRRPVAAGAVSRRVRRRTQRHPQSSRHRVPRMGCDEEQPDRRGRGDRGAGVGHPARRRRHPRHRQVGVRDPRRRGGLQGWGAGAGDR